MSERSWRAVVLGASLGAFVVAYQARLVTDDIARSTNAIAQNAILADYLRTLDAAYAAHDLLGDIYRRHFNGFVSTTIDQARQGVFEISMDELPHTAITVIDNAKKKIRATSYVTGSQWWRTAWGKTYLEANKEAVKRGVQIERIFIFPDQKDFQSSQELLTENKKAGVQVKYILATDLEQPFTRDVIIVDDSFVGLLELEQRSIRKILFSASQNNIELVNRTLRIAGTGAKDFK